MDLSGHHSNPRGPLESLLSAPRGTPRPAVRAATTGQASTPSGEVLAIGTRHPRQGRLISAVARVLGVACAPMRAEEVHAAVEALLGERVRRTSVKATLAGNLDGPTPRFVRVARGLYRIGHWRETC
jgi:hypothetical protein